MTERQPSAPPLAVMTAAMATITSADETIPLFLFPLNSQTPLEPSRGLSMRPTRRAGRRVPRVVGAAPELGGRTIRRSGAFALRLLEHAGTGQGRRSVIEAAVSAHLSRTLPIRQASATRPSISLASPAATQKTATVSCEPSPDTTGACSRSGVGSIGAIATFGGAGVIAGPVRNQRPKPGFVVASEGSRLAPGFRRSHDVPG